MICSFHIRFCNCCAWRSVLSLWTGVFTSWDCSGRAPTHWAQEVFGRVMASDEYDED